jgi:ABC-2 type transport system permease protein
LVARREITTRLQPKAFRISTLVLLGLLIGLSVVLRFVGGSSAHPVGFTSQNAALAAPFAALSSVSGTQVQTSTVPDRVTGERQIRAGTLDALVVGGAGASPGARRRVWWRRSPAGWWSCCSPRSNRGS